MFHTLCNYKNGVFRWNYRFQLQLTYSTRLFWCITTTCDQMQVATEYHDLVHLRACLTCLSWDHKWSLGTMTTEYYDSVRFIRDHNGSLGTMATEYNDYFVWLATIMDHLAEWQSNITGKTQGIILSGWYVKFLFTILYFEAKSMKFKSIISGMVLTYSSRVT